MFNLYILNLTKRDEPVTECFNCGLPATRVVTVGPITMDCCESNQCHQEVEKRARDIISGKYRRIK